MGRSCKGQETVFGNSDFNQGRVCNMGNARNSRFAVWRAHKGHNGENRLRVTWGGGKSRPNMRTGALGIDGKVEAQER